MLLLLSIEFCSTLGTRFVGNRYSEVTLWADGQIACAFAHAGSIVSLDKNLSARWPALGSESKGSRSDSLLNICFHLFQHFVGPPLDLVPTLLSFLDDGWILYQLQIALCSEY